MEIYVLVRYRHKDVAGFNRLMLTCKNKLRVGVMVFNTTFNNISVISWQSVFRLEETANLPKVTEEF